MKTFLLLFNSKYSELAKVCEDSIKSFSQNQCLSVNIGHDGESQLWFTYYRYKWLKEYLPSSHGATCLIDADMIATPRVDEIWNLVPENGYFPLFEYHPHQPIFTELRNMVNVCDDFTYRHYVPSLWNSRCAWFASAGLNTMSVIPQIGEEHSANLVSWRCNIQNYFDCVTVSSLEAKKHWEGLFYHGEKSPEKALDLLNSVKKMASSR